MEKNNAETKRFALKDYLALAISLFLAIFVWLVHNLSLSYSDMVRVNLTANCKIDGHADRSTNSAGLAVRCNMNGYDLLWFTSRERDLDFSVDSEDMHGYGGDVFYMTATDLTQYFHDLFGNESTLEYFITDTVFFKFPSVECRKVPVNAVVTLDFKPQYMASDELKLSQDSVLVYGNESQIRAVTAVNTEPIHLTSLCEDVYGEIGLESIKTVRLSVSKVKFSLPVTRYVEQQVKVPVRMDDVPEGQTVKVYPAYATLTVRTVFPSKSDFSSTYVSVSYDEFSGSLSGKCAGQPENLPDGILRVNVQPDFFECIIHAQ